MQPIFEDMAQFTEEEKTIRRIDKRFNKGVVQYGLIEEGDKILIEGTAKAQKVAKETMKKVKRAMKLDYFE